MEERHPHPHRIKNTHRGRHAARWKWLASTLIVLVGILGYFVLVSGNIFSLQSKCAAQAEKALASFTKGLPKSQSYFFGQANHYNQKMNQCFVIISTPFVPPKALFDPDAAFTQPSGYEYLFDAYDNTEMA